MGRHPDTVQYFFVAYEIPFRYQECVGRIACCVSTAGIGGEGLDPERIVRAQRLGRSNYSRKAAGDVGHPLTPNLDQITLKSVTQNAIVRITIFGSFRSARRQANMPAVGPIPVHPTVNRPF